MIVFFLFLGGFAVELYTQHTSDIINNNVLILIFVQI